MLDFQKKKQLSILVKIAMVDEEFSDAEKSTIRKIADRYGASDDELQAIFTAPSLAESLAPMSVVEKMNFMIDCIMVILADKMVTASEEYFARQMASRLGFNQEVVPALLANKDKTHTEMQELMLKFMI